MTKGIGALPLSFVLVGALAGCHAGDEEARTRTAMQNAENAAVRAEDASRRAEQAAGRAEDASRRAEAVIEKFGETEERHAARRRR